MNSEVVSNNDVDTRQLLSANPKELPLTGSSGHRSSLPLGKARNGSGNLNGLDSGHFWPLNAHGPAFQRRERTIKPIELAAAIAAAC